jgi:DNA-binding transcriptional regulator/RsmH inhibitor MraZ
MSGEFLGTFDISVHKSRIVIPANFKKKFADEANKTVVVTLGPVGTVAVFPMDTWLLMREKLQSSISESDKELLSNLVDFAMPEQELEGPGRVRISEDLLKIANIKESVKIKGEGHFLTLWNPESLEEIRQQKVEIHKVKYGTSNYQLNNIPRLS